MTARGRSGLPKKLYRAPLAMDRTCSGQPTSRIYRNSRARKGSQSDQGSVHEDVRLVQLLQRVAVHAPTAASGPGEPAEPLVHPTLLQLASDNSV